METMIDPVVPKVTGWSVHRVVLAVLAVLATALSLTVWFHPTLGFAQGGFLDGADLRADMIKIVWIGFAVFAAVSSAAVLITKSMRNRALASVLSYALGAGALVPAILIVDKFI